VKRKKKLALQKRSLTLPSLPKTAKTGSNSKEMVVQTPIHTSSKELTESITLGLNLTPKLKKKECF
jgi:hypothetical protein